MAYTDYVNVAAPSFWNEGQSGFLASDWYSSSQTDLAVVKTRIDYPLASVWNGTRYEPYGRPSLFEFDSPLTLSQIWVDVKEDAGYTGLWVYAPDNTLLFGDRLSSLSNPSIDIEEGGSPRSRVFHYTFPGASTVKAFVVADQNGYPQGMPSLLYGIYGTQLAGAPPPFWTDFNRTQERRFA